MNIQHYMRMAYNYATMNSHDNSTHVGAVIVGCKPITLVGTNRFSSVAQNIPENLERSRKYPRIVHAERDVIFTATILGTSLNNTIMVCPFACCPECAQAIVCAGIKAVYAHKEALDQTPDRWEEEIEIGCEILRDGNVAYHKWSGAVGQCENLFDGKIWYP